MSLGSSRPSPTEPTLKINNLLYQCFDIVQDFNDCYLNLEGDNIDKSPTRTPWNSRKGFSWDPGITTQGFFFPNPDRIWPQSGQMGQNQGSPVCGWWCNGIDAGSRSVYRTWTKQTSSSNLTEGNCFCVRFLASVSVVFLWLFSEENIRSHHGSSFRHILTYLSNVSIHVTVVMEAPLAYEKPLSNNLDALLAFGRENIFLSQTPLHVLPKKTNSDAF